MQKRYLRDILVSSVGMGCMGFSHGYGKAPDESYAIEAIRKAYEAGCTFFDTAEAYGKEMFFEGHNEQLVGKAVEPFRKDVALATKFFIDKSEYGKGLSLYDAILKHLVKSLKNLKTDYIELYYLHRINEEIPVEEIAKVMERLIKSGAVRGWGLSQVGADSLKTAHEVTPISAVQNLYSILERDCESEIFPYCLKNNIGVVPFSPTGSGFLSGKVNEKSDFSDKDDVRKFVPQLALENMRANQPILEILEDFSKRKNCTNAQISMAWMLHKYPNVVPIPGSKNLERIIENLGSADVEFTQSEFEELENRLSTCRVFGHRGSVESKQNSFGNNWAKK